MSILQLRFNKATLPSGYIAVDKGDTVPPWWDANPATTASKTRTKSNWYHDATPSPRTPDIFVNHRSSDLRAMFQFGQDLPLYATAKFFSWRYELQNEKLHADGSVTATIVVHVDPSYSRHAQPSGAGIPITESMSVAGTQVFSYSGRSIDEFDKAASPATVSKTITIASKAEASGMDVVFHAHYTDGSHPDVNLTLGIKLYNPSPSTYKPMLEKVGGKWVRINDGGKNISVKRNGAWKTTPQEQLVKAGTVNPGTYHVYKHGTQWYQMPVPTHSTG